MWTTRLMLEAHQHEVSLFATLTYAKEFLPDDRSVSVREAQLFLKRLRERVSLPFRYFIVGEYGDQTWRPHYHACLFGVREAVAIGAAWGKGISDVHPLTYELAQYCCGYTVKKLTKKDDPRLRGLAPEFARMSLRPGIGAGAESALRDALIDQATGEILAQDDVPGAVRVNGAMWPIGRYLRRRLRLRLGMAGAESAGAAAARRAREALRWPVRELRKNDDPKELKRLQDSRRARARQSINRTKRGL